MELRFEQDPRKAASNPERLVASQARAGVAEIARYLEGGRVGRRHGARRSSRSREQPTGSRRRGG
jgi:hypothetical protein